MQEQRETYQGKEIVIRIASNGPQLLIDKMDVDVSLDEITGRYSTHHLPYTDYASVLNLAKHLIDSQRELRL